MPDPETPAPPRFMPIYDNVLLGHADRRRIVSDEDRRRFLAGDRFGTAGFLVDGFGAGTWSVERSNFRATLIIQPLRRLAAGERNAVEEEGARLLAFLAGDASDRQVRFRPAES